VAKWFFALAPTTVNESGPAAWIPRTSGGVPSTLVEAIEYGDAFLIYAPADAGTFTLDAIPGLFVYDPDDYPIEPWDGANGIIFLDFLGDVLPISYFFDANVIKVVRHADGNYYGLLEDASSGQTPVTHPTKWKEWPTTTDPSTVEGFSVFGLFSVRGNVTPFASPTTPFSVRAGGVTHPFVLETGSGNRQWNFGWDSGGGNPFTDDPPDLAAFLASGWGCTLVKDAGLAPPNSPRISFLIAWGTYEGQADVALFPEVNAGPEQIALGPLPSSVTLQGIFTPSANFEQESFLWTQVDQPEGGPTAGISAPTSLTTQITFGTYVPGIYTFRLTAFGKITGVDSVEVSTPQHEVSGETTVIVPLAVAPVINGPFNAVVEGGESTLSPLVNYDGWSGDLTFLWEQISGPAATINSPTDRETTITYAGNGRHVFRLTITSDLFTSTMLFMVFRVGEFAATPESTSPLVVTGRGGRIIGTLIQSSSIEEVLNEVPNRCRFTVIGTQVEIGEPVVITQDGRKIFAGNVLEVSGGRVEAGT
jgi:hypothetical protein